MDIHPERTIVLRLPLKHRLTLVVCSLLSIFLSIGAEIGGNRPVAWFFAAFTIVVLLLTRYVLVWRITLDPNGDGFAYRRWLLHTYEVDYRDITGYRFGASGVWILWEGKHLWLDDSANGYETLIQLLQKRMVPLIPGKGKKSRIPTAPVQLSAEVPTRDHKPKGFRGWVSQVAIGALELLLEIIGEILPELFG